MQLLTVRWTGWSVYPFALRGINLLTATEISKQKYKFIEYYYAVFFFLLVCFFIVFSTVLVSLAAVFSIVTQRSSLCGEERCVTILKTAARETTTVCAYLCFHAKFKSLTESKVVT